MIPLGSTKTIQGRLGEHPQSAEAAPAAPDSAPGASSGGHVLTWEGARFEPIPGGGVRVLRVDGSSPLSGTLLHF